MARTQPHGEAFVGQRQLHARRRDALAADDHGQVVQRAARPEDALEHGGGDLRVELHALRGQPREARAALDHHERAEPVAAEELDRLVERVDERVEVAPLARSDRLAQAHHRLAQLRLEHDEQEDRDRAEQALAQEAQSGEALAEQAREPDAQQQHRHEDDRALEDAGAAGSLQEPQHEQHADEDDRQLDRHAQRVTSSEELEESVEHEATVPRSPSTDR